MGDSDLEAMMALSYYTAKPKKGSEITLPSSNNLLRESTDSYYGSAVMGRAGSSDTDGSSVAAVARSERGAILERFQALLDGEGEK